MSKVHGFVNPRSGSPTCIRLVDADDGGVYLFQVMHVTGPKIQLPIDGLDPAIDEKESAG